jgi:hypothetical protein
MGETLRDRAREFMNNPTVWSMRSDEGAEEMCRALGLDPDTPADWVIVAIDPATLPVCRTCGSGAWPGQDATGMTDCPDCQGTGRAPWVAVALDPLIAKHLTALLQYAGVSYRSYLASAQSGGFAGDAKTMHATWHGIPAEVWERLREVLR